MEHLGPSTWVTMAEANNKNTLILEECSVPNDLKCLFNLCFPVTLASCFYLK